MSTVLTQSIIQGCTDAVDSYASQAQDLNQQLRDLMSRLIGTDYVGDGADGFQALFNSKIVPAVENNLLMDAGALIPKLREAFEFIRTQLIMEADVKIGQANNDAASGAGGASV